MPYALLTLLVLFLAWFIYGMKTKKYAPPTNSVFLIGLVVSILGWVFFYEDVSGGLWFGLICSYGLSTLILRGDVERQGMFWRVSAVRFDWSSKPWFKSFKTSGFKPWPRWKFGYVASEPVRPPGQLLDAYDFFCWKENGWSWNEEIGEKFRCTVTIRYEFKAESTVENVRALIAFEDGVPDEEKGRYKQYLLEEKIKAFLVSSLRERIITAVKESAASFSVGSNRKIILKDQPNPLRVLVPGLRPHYNSRMSVEYELLQVA